MINSLTITKPDDLHLHLRDGVALAAVVSDTARQFARAIVMPNLKPPITTVAQAQAYYQRIKAALPPHLIFEPLMTLYLTDNTSPLEIEAAAKSGVVKAVKYYPAGATTNSDSGVTDLAKCAAVLAAMQEVGMPLLLHGEVTDSSVDMFDREKVFIEKNMIPLVLKYPKLKMVFEHITTANAAKFVLAASDNIAATITPQHLLLNRNALFVGGLRPHNYCLPVLKREEHRLALVKAATSGNKKFFLGTDSAPHARDTKESCCGFAGCYSANAAMEYYAAAFESVGALDKLEAFASHFGADFYGMPRNKETITLKREPWSVPQEVPFTESGLVPLLAGETLAWKLV
jgi:dihydroorotase